MDLFTISTSVLGGKRLQVRILSARFFRKRPFGEHVEGPYFFRDGSCVIDIPPSVKLSWPRSRGSVLNSLSSRPPSSWNWTEQSQLRWPLVLKLASISSVRRPRSHHFSAPTSCQACAAASSSKSAAAATSPARSSSVRPHSRTTPANASYRREVEY